MAANRVFTCELAQSCYNLPGVHRLTWGGSVVAEVRDEKGLGIHHHDSVRRDPVLKGGQGVYLLRPRVVEVLVHNHVAEVDLKGNKIAVRSQGKTRPRFGGQRRYSEVIGKVTSDQLTLCHSKCDK